MTRPTPTATRDGERGVAMLMEVLVGIVVTGLILVVGLATASDRQEKRLDASHESAEAWIDAAGQIGRASCRERVSSVV